jgi:hypothetical protein
MDVATATVRIVEDPCLFEVAQLVLKLHELEQRPGVFTPIPPGPPGPPPPPAPPVRGVGLCTAVTPLKAVVYLKTRPWILPLALAAVVGGLVGVGYLIGSTPPRPRPKAGGS